MLYEIFIENKRGGKRAPTTLARYGTLYKTCIEPPLAILAGHPKVKAVVLSAPARFGMSKTSYEGC